MTSAANSTKRLPGPGTVPACAQRWPLTRVAVLALLGTLALGCAGRVVEAGSDTAEGEAVLAALEHVAEIMWEPEWRTLVRGRAAIAHDGEEPLAAATRSFLDEAIAARGWRWSTEEPLVPTGNCRFPSGGDCRLKDPTELHLTFTVWPWPEEVDYTEETYPLLPLNQFRVKPVPGKEGYKVHVEWLSSFRLREGGHRAELGGEGLLVTRQSEGWVVEVVMSWIT